MSILLYFIYLFYFFRPWYALYFPISVCLKASSIGHHRGRRASRCWESAGSVDWDSPPNVVKFNTAKVICLWLQPIGGMVGWQIRLEAKKSSSSVLCEPPLLHLVVTQYSSCRYSAFILHHWNIITPTWNWLGIGLGFPRYCRRGTTFEIGFPGFFDFLLLFIFVWVHYSFRFLKKLLMLTSTLRCMKDLLIRIFCLSYCAGCYTVDPICAWSVNFLDI